MLTFSKGGTPLKRVASISDLVTQAAEFSLHGSNLRADIYVADDLWRSAVDPTQIEQVINALVINAREAMPQGGTVRVSANNIELADSGLPIRPGRYVKVQVSDTGDGIDAVWDESYRGDSNLVDVYVRRLRDKVDRPFGSRSVETVRGVGYRLAEGEHDTDPA